MEANLWWSQRTLAVPSVCLVLLNQTLYLVAVIMGGELVRTFLVLKGLENHVEGIQVFDYDSFWSRTIFIFLHDRAGIQEVILILGNFNITFQRSYSSVPTCIEH